MTPSPTPASLGERFIPVIPTEFQVYECVPRFLHRSPTRCHADSARSSYTVDPQWQIKFTIIWTSVLAFTTLLSIPYICRSFLNGRLYSGLSINESDGVAKAPSPSKRTGSSRFGTSNPLSKAFRGARAVVQSLGLWTLPMPNLNWWKSQVGDCCRRAYFSLGLAQIGIILAYAGIVVACFVTGAQLTQNSNRPGENNSCIPQPQ
jgi:ferric-chelate reductase